MKRFGLTLLLVLGLCSFSQAATDYVVTSGAQTSALTGDINLVKNTDGEYTISLRNTYTGTTTIDAGSLKITYTPDWEGFSALSNTAITINANGTLNLANVNALGKPGNGSLGKLNSLITVNGGTILNSQASNHVNLTNTVLNGGTITTTGSGSGDYGSFLLCGSLSVTEDAVMNASKITVRSRSVGDTNAGIWTVAEGKTFSVAPTNGTGRTNIRMNDYDGTNSILEKFGKGTLKLQAAFINGGTLKIHEGEVNMVGANGAWVLGSTAVEMTNSTLRLSKLSDSEKMGELSGKISGTGTIIDESGVFGHHVSADLSGFTGVFDAKTTMVFKNPTAGMNGVELKANGNEMCFTENCKAEVGMISGGGTIRPSNAVQSTLKVVLAVGNDTTYANNTFSGVIRDQYDTTSLKTWTMAITKNGSNTWRLTNANTYTGGTTINAGTLQIANDKALSSGTVTLNGGALMLEGSVSGTAPNFTYTIRNLANNIVIASDSTIQATGHYGRLSGTLTGSANITTSGDKQIQFAGSMADYSGTITSTTDWITFRGNATDAQNVNVVVNGTGMAVVNDVSSTFQFASLSGTGELRPSVEAKENSTAVLKTSSGNHSGNINNQSSGNRLVALEKIGDGTWTLSGANSNFSGGTTITQGVLAVGSDKALGSGTVKLNGGTLQAAENRTLANPVTVAADSKIDVAAGKTLTLTQKVSGTQTVELTGGTLSASSMESSVKWNLNGGTLQLTDGLNPFANTVTGTGTLFMNTNTNTEVTGDLSGFYGTFKAQPGYATIFNTASSMKNMTLQNVGKDMCFKDRGVAVDAEVGSIIGNGVLRPSTAAGKEIVINVGNDVDNSAIDHTFSGTIQNAGGDGSWVLGINKVGTSIWTLSGNSSYSGATTVSGGTLEVKGSIASSAVTVTQDGTLSLNGGNIGQTVTVEDGGTIISTSTATIAGGLTLKGGATLVGDYLGKIRLEKNSQIVMDLSKGSPDLQFNDSSIIEDDITLTIDAADVEVGEVFDLIRTNDVDILDKIIQDIKNADPKISWLLNYTPGAVAGELGLLQLTAALNTDVVPEPSTAILLLLGLFGLLSFRRKA